MVVTGALLVVVLMNMLAQAPWQLWPLQGAAVGVLAATAGWCLDEPAAAVVDPAPHGLRWRTLARTLGVLPLLGVWCATVWYTRDSLFGHPDVVLVQGLAATAITTAWVTGQRARGEATPGRRAACWVVPVALAWSLTRPLPALLPVFPYAGGGEHGDWGASLVVWSVSGVVALVVLVHVLAPRTPRRWGSSARLS